MLGGKVEAAVAAVARRHGLSHAALNALAVIEGEGGPISAGEVSARMHITTGTMTSVLDTLERNGYVQRSADPDDRRRVLVDITPSAQAVLDQMLPEVQQLAKTVMSALSDEHLQELLGHLSAIDASLAAVPDQMPPPAERRTPPRLKRT